MMRWSQFATSYRGVGGERKVPGTISPLGLGWEGVFRPFRACEQNHLPALHRTQAFSLGFVRSPPWGSPAHMSRLSLTGFWDAAGEAGAPPGEAQNPKEWLQEIGNMVPVPIP
jgi:hypothetical protein